MIDKAVSAFIERWSKSGGAEPPNYQLFLAELCDVLGVPRPDPTQPDDHENAYVFERNVRFDNLDGTFSTGRIDRYKRNCHMSETKHSWGICCEAATIRLSFYAHWKAPPK